MYVIEFAPPISGIDGKFNTFRIGLKWSKLLKAGDKVYLLNKKESAVIGIAAIEEVLTGELRELANRHAAHNHNQKLLDYEGAADRLIANLTRLYGPQIITETKKTTVLYMRRIE